MEKIKLEMEFIDDANKKFVVILEEPRLDLTPQEVEQAMNDIISHNVFKSGNNPLKEAKDARVIITTINKIEF